MGILFTGWRMACHADGTVAAVTSRPLYRTVPSQHSANFRRWLGYLREGIDITFVPAAVGVLVREEHTAAGYRGASTFLHLPVDGSTDQAGWTYCAGEQTWAQLAQRYPASKKQAKFYAYELPAGSQLRELRVRVDHANQATIFPCNCPPVPPDFHQMQPINPTEVEMFLPSIAGLNWNPVVVLTKFRAAADPPIEAPGRDPDCLRVATALYHVFSSLLHEDEVDEAYALQEELRSVNYPPLSDLPEPLQARLLHLLSISVPVCNHEALVDEVCSLTALLRLIVPKAFC
eukprot:m.334183 g.334183  ORF g.334183 m.334183 type:complete len:289 (-) comp55662_c0_seq9:398-1264(-)